MAYNITKSSKEAKTIIVVDLSMVYNYIFGWPMNSSSVSLKFGTNFESKQTQTVQMYTLSSDSRKLG